MQEMSLEIDEADNAPTLNRCQSASVPEITFKAVILAILLTVILGASNAYLALGNVSKQLMC